MAITFGDIYRDVTSRLSDIGIASNRFMRKDLVTAINDSVRQLQTEFVKNRKAEDLAVTETVTPSSTDSNYPFLYSATLSQPVMEELPLARTVYNSLVTVADSIPDATDSFSEGDTKVKDDKLYKAVSDGSSINAYNLTFKPEDIRNYYNNNGLEFEAGDIVKNQSDGTYWRCDTAYTNNQGETISASGNFTQVYWMEIGDAHAEAMPLDMPSIFQAKLYEDMHESYPFSIQQDTFYAIQGDLDYYISYVPEWQDIEDFTTDMDVPESMIPMIKDMAMQKLSIKIQVDIETQTQMTDDEE